MAALLEPILNQILQAEMTNYLGAGPEERTDDRQGYRNGSYPRKLITRVGTLDLLTSRAYVPSCVHTAPGTVPAGSRTVQ